MDLLQLRAQIDKIDDEMVRLFQQRMAVSAEVAEYKRAKNMPVYDREREQQKLLDLTSKADERFEPYIAPLYSLIFELSRAEQERVLSTEAKT